MIIEKKEPIDLFVETVQSVDCPSVDASSREYFVGVSAINTSGLTLICGSNIYDTGKEDRRKRYKNAIGVDLVEGECVDVVANLEDRRIVHKIGPFRHVECLSVLEHSRKPWLMAQNIKAMMMPGATILLSAPFVWRRHDYPNDYWRFTVDGVKELFTGINWVAAAYHHSGKLDFCGKMPTVRFNGVKMVPRTEVFMLGVR